MSLHNAIQDYYFDNISELPHDKQFHLASRLSAWCNDPRAIDLLEAVRPTLHTTTIRQDLASLIADPPTAKINAAERRAPYFAKYPALRGYMLALFRVRHLLFHYGIDERDTLLTLVGKEELYALSDTLQQDDEAVSVLSTYAINYIYLVEAILFPRGGKQLGGFVNHALDLADTYDDTPEDSLLLIYLFTHCIIGASNFYQEAVSGPAYTRMLEILEQRILTHFDHINLDNKFEFLVCCRLTGYTTSLDEPIAEEALQSISPDGTFVIDTLNHAGQGNKTSFADSEHRNVLYIMSQLPFAQQKDLE